jgi:hypothetical protein
MKHKTQREAAMAAVEASGAKGWWPLSASELGFSIVLYFNREDERREEVMRDIRPPDGGGSSAGDP